MNDELSAYAPIRLRGRSYYRYARQAAQFGAITAEGMITTDLHDQIYQDLIAPQMALTAQAVREEGVDGVIAGQTITKQLSYSDWVPLLGQYEASGKQIFDLHDSLTELLRQTDVGECTLEDLHMPYACVYLQFGKLLDVKHAFDSEAGTFEYMDGVFVALSPWSEAGSRIKMGFSTVHEDGTGVMYPGLFFDLLPDERKLPVLQGIEAALDRRQREHQASEDSHHNYQAVMAHARDADDEAADTLCRAASLVVNALFYIESLRENLPHPTPGRDTPPTMSAKWAAANPRQQLKQRSALSADGYTVVRLVGTEVAGQASGAPTGTSRKVHWRRGHWRQQPYGEHMALRRRTWIKPVLVGGSEAPAELPGHRYVLSGTDRPQ